MSIRTLLFLHAALLPAGALAVLVLVGGVLLRGALLSAVDEGLNSLAAVEAISLFDASPAPHLHLSRSPLRNQVEAFAPSRAIYDAEGRLVVSEVTTAPVPEEVDPAAVGRVELSTLAYRERSLRELRVGVLSPSEARYTMVLRSSLEPIERTVLTYYRVLGTGAALVSLGFIIVQARMSRWWAERIHNMIRHTRRLESGDLSSRPDPDPHDDEIGELVSAIGRASARLEEARQAQDRLVADAAHELRTPLAAVRAEIDVTLRRPRSADSLREALERIREEVDRLGRLSTRLLDLARLAASTLRLERGDLARVVREELDAHRSVAEVQEVSLVPELPPALAARFDGAGVRQAVGNLLDNAIKFTPRGGTVRVRLETPAGTWRLTVEDEGPGIPEAEWAAVFEPFCRLDARVGGTGLGLAIVRDVARGHRGEVWVEPSPVGARFVLEAPT